MNDALTFNGKTLHPDMRALIAARDKVGIGETIDEMRATWTAYSALLSQPHPADMRVDDRMLACAHGPVGVRVYRPAKARAAAPCILYSHGGGFMKGDLDSSDSAAWGLAEACGAVVVSVDYRLAPEHPFPAAFEDVYGVLCYIAENPGHFGVDLARIAVCGDSAGGNLSAAVTLAARDRGGPAIRAQALVYPGTGLDQQGGSYEANANAPGLTSTATRRYRDWYLQKEKDHADPYARPVIAESHAGLPPAWVHTAEFDPIRDDGEVYAKKLRAAGVPVEYRCAQGMIHGFLRARFTGEGGKAEFAALTGWLRRALAS